MQCIRSIRFVVGWMNGIGQTTPKWERGDNQSVENAINRRKMIFVADILLFNYR